MGTKASGYKHQHHLKGKVESNVPLLGDGGSRATHVRKQSAQERRYRSGSSRRRRPVMMVGMQSRRVRKVWYAGH